ncbi:MAG: hypothetical protein V3V08_13675 [Nannocystaceae bacterium]
MSRDAHLHDLRERTAQLVSSLKAGHGTVDEVRLHVAGRQDLVDSLDRGVGELTELERRLLQEISALDRYVAIWCAQAQQELARRLVRRPRAQQQTVPSHPRIISQSA